LQIHTCLCGLFPGFRHGAGDVEDACWQLLGELQLLVPSHEEHMYLGRLMEPVADRVPFYTPGPPFKVCASVEHTSNITQLLIKHLTLHPVMFTQQGSSRMCREMYLDAEVTYIDAEGLQCVAAATVYAESH
jgi:hypothetical protein